MSVLYTILLVLFIINALLLTTVILLQSGKGGMGTIFGGGGAGSVFGATGGATLLSKLTTIFAIIFMALSFGLARITIDNASVDPKAKKESATPSAIEVTPTAMTTPKKDNNIKLTPVKKGATKTPIKTITINPDKKAPVKIETKKVDGKVAPTPEKKDPAK